MAHQNKEKQEIMQDPSNPFGAAPGEGLIGGLSGGPATGTPAGPGSQGGAGGDVIRTATMATFMAEVIEASHSMPIIVDFWADWCQPCKQLTPTLEKVVRESGGKTRLVKINVDENQELAAQLRIQSLPTVMAFVGGQPVDGFAGALPESQVRAFIQKATSGMPASPAEQIIAMAQQALEEGDHMAAIEGFGHVAQAEPGNADALGGLARAYVALGKLDEARQILDSVPANRKTHAAVEGAEAALKLALQTQDTGDIAPLEEKVAANGDDHDARFELSLAYAGAGRRDEAAEALLEIIRRDREWNDDAARKQLVSMFEAAGPTNPFTVATRRKLSSILFS